MLFGRRSPTREMITEGERCGLSPEAVAEAVRALGRRGFWSFIEDRRAAAAVFDERYPKLRAFEGRVRGEWPPSAPASLSAGLRAATAAVGAAVERAERTCSGGPHHAALFLAPVWLLPTVQGGWPGRVERGVFLTPGEFGEWGRLHPEPDGDGLFRWCVTNTFDAVVNPPPREPLSGEWPAESPGSTLVLVMSGCQWGMMAGGEVEDLWRVNPNGDVEFVCRVGGTSF